MSDIKLEIEGVTILIGEACKDDAGRICRTVQVHMVDSLPKLLEIGFIPAGKTTPNGHQDIGLVEFEFRSVA